MEQKRVAFHTLGCRVNQYETEAMKHLFEARGYQIVGETDPADVYVVNTCTVTGLADRKSRQYIRRMKKANQDAVTVVNQPVLPYGTSEASLYALFDRHFMKTR